MGRTGLGTFLGVTANWFREYQVDEPALKAVFADIRNEACGAGCVSYPGRDDVAASETLFRDVIERYEKKTGATVPAAKHAHFRRWVLLLFKGGDMPKS